MKLNDRTYDWLKWLCCLLLPAIGTFYVRLAGTWGLPYAEQVGQTAQEIAFLIGAIIGISTAQYYKDNK